MANPSPLTEQFDQADAQIIPLGESGAVVALHDVLEVEYAAVRKASGLMDSPQRAVVTLTGGDRLDFLHRMLTNDVASMKPGRVRRAFLLTAKGRIIADMFVLHADDATHLDVDVFTVGALVDELNNLLFGEDVQVDDRRENWHRLSLHGPKAQAIIDAGSAASATPFEPGEYREITVGKIGVFAYRQDECGETGLHLWGPTEHVGPLWQALTELGEGLGMRPLGWMAYNTARIEAGSPLFMVDFDSNALPGETGLLDQAVNFTKGCYRGQEIVARLKDVGHPAQTLVGFIVEDDKLPVAGTPVYAEAQGEPIGAVTSSTIAPMRGGRAIGFAMVKWAYREVGTTLYTPAEGTTIEIKVQPLSQDS